MKLATKLKLATRLNSILPLVDHNVLKALQELSNVDGITCVDLNYPEHFQNHSIQELKHVLDETGLKVNGVALRFRSEFKNGELGNSDQSISDEAFELCRSAIEACRELGGEVITIWLGYDGFDYPFQIDYLKAWDQVKGYFQRMADLAPDLKFSIEYKPFQPRAYALIDSVGVTMLMVNEINRENVGVTLDYCHMLMKHENPAYGLNLVAAKNKLYGVHINDGYGLNDDGLMVGTSSFMQTLEFMYYLKKFNYQDAIYFDTFPERENPLKECEMNVKLINKISNLVDSIGLTRLEEIVEKNDAIAANQILLDCLK